MKRKDFLKKGALGLGIIISAPVLTTSCGNNDDSFSDTLEANLSDSLTGKTQMATSIPRPSQWQTNPVLIPG